jgi:hypothetical protein
MFEACVQQALKFPEPEASQQEEVYRLLQIGQFYPDALPKPKTAEPVAPDSRAEKGGKESLEQKAYGVAPEITEAVQTRLTQLGDFLNRAKR